MFVTRPHLEQFVPPGLASPRSRFWRGVSLSLDTPWYLCVVAPRDGGPTETLLIAWESELLDLLTTQTACTNVRSVARMDKPNAASGQWELRSIGAIWESTSCERSEVGRLVLRFEGESQFRDELLHEVQRNDARPLIFSAQTAR